MGRLDNGDTTPSPSSLAVDVFRQVCIVASVLWLVCRVLSIKFCVCVCVGGGGDNKYGWTHMALQGEGMGREPHRA